MKIFGTKRENIKNNRFVPLIFELKKQFYRQKTKNEFQYYFEKIVIPKDEISEMFELKSEKDYDKNFNEAIYGFCESEDVFFYGTTKELFPYLFNKMDEINDSLVKLKISRILSLNGQTKKLELDRDVFFRKKNISIEFDDEINFVTIDNLSKDTEDLLNNKLDKYSKEIELNDELKWKHIILSEPNELDNVYIDKFRFRLTEVFDLLVKNNKNRNLTDVLIDNHNSVVSYNIENNITPTKEVIDDNQNTTNLMNIVQYIKSKNNA